MAEDSRKSLTPRLHTAAKSVGIAVALFGVFSDLVVGGTPGMGIKQWALVLAGVGLFAAGALDRDSRSRLRVWVRDNAHALSLSGLLTFAILVGIFGGLAELLIIAVDRFIVNGFVRVGPSAVWMIPTLNTATFVLIALILWIASRLWPKLATPSFVGFILILIAADAMLHRVRAHGQIASEAKLVLIGALAWTLGRSAATRFAAMRQAMRTRIAVTAAVMVAVLGGAAALHPWWKERSALAALPDASSGRVNLLFIILDTVRSASLSLYGYERETTPELERFAAGGVVFERAISPSSWTLPSHGSMFTGRYPSELEVDWLTPYDGRFPTVAEALASAGYATAGFSANVGYVSVESGLAQGFARFEDFVPTAGEFLRTSMLLRRVLRPFGLEDVSGANDRGRKFAPDVNQAFLRWLADRPDDRPFFAFLNYFDTHAPYNAPAPYDTLFGGARRLKPWGPGLNEEQVEAWRDAYDRALVHLDANLGELFRALEAQGALDNTVVIISSDHGEHIGENSYMGHATTLYRPVLEVPLVVRGPGIPAGKHVKTRVSLRNIAATLLDLAAVPQGAIPGASLASVWKGDAREVPIYSELGRGLRIRQRYPNAEHALWSIYERDLHYILSSSGEEELYRISADPGEENNLMTASPAPLEAVSFRTLLRTHFDATGQQDGVHTARTETRK